MCAGKWIPLSALLTVLTTGIPLDTRIYKHSSKTRVHSSSAPHSKRSSAPTLVGKLPANLRQLGATLGNQNQPRGAYFVLHAVFPLSSILLPPGGDFCATCHSECCSKGFLSHVKKQNLEKIDLNMLTTYNLEKRMC